MIRRLGVEDDRAEEREEREARLAANKAALARINELTAAHGVNADAAQRLRDEYNDRIGQLEVSEPEPIGRPHHLFSSEYERLSSELLQLERKVILQLRNHRVINDEVLRHIQRDIDLAEARLGHPSAG